VKPGFCEKIEVARYHLEDICVPQMGTSGLKPVSACGESLTIGKCTAHHRGAP